LTPVEIRPTFKKRLRKKPPEMRKAVEDAVTQLRKDWRHPGLRTHRIQNKQGVYGARLGGGNRLTFHWDEGTIVLRNHCNHDILHKP
jgi:mRNA-degrading endonuclease RelE of RelBE toxin-antitoxin system